MAAFSGCTDARNSRAGKVLSILLAGSLSLSFLNLTAMAAPAYADDPEGTPTEETSSGDTEANPTQDALHQDWVNTYSFVINVAGHEYPLEAATQILTGDEPIQMPNAPVVTGYNFTGWELSEDAGRYVNGGEGSYTAKVTDTEHDGYCTFVGSYKPIYAIAFMDDVNNVVATKLLDENKLGEDSLTAANEAYEPASGYVLAGWSVDRNSNAIIPWDSFAMDYNLTVYPVVEQGTWVKMDAQGGTFVPSVLRQADGTIKLPSNPVLAGYEFAGWYTTQDGQGDPVKSPAESAGATVPVDATTTTLYAQWVPATNAESSAIIATPDNTGGNETDNEGKSWVSAVANRAATDAFTCTVPVVPGQAPSDNSWLNDDGTVREMTLIQSLGIQADSELFLGWYYMDNGTYRPFNMAGDVPTNDIQLTARWRSQATGTVTYQEGEDITRSDGRTYDPAASVFVEGPAGDSYVANKRFDHWINGANDTVNANELAPISTAQGVLTAAYEEYVELKTHTITYHANYGTTGVDEPANVVNSFNHNAATTLLSEVAGVPEGMVLSSWNTEADGSGVMFYPNDQWRVRGDIDLYAQYTRDTSAFQLAGYTTVDGAAYVTAEYTGQEQRVELVGQDNVLLSGEKFVWWYEDNEGNGRWVDSAKTFGPNVGEQGNVRVAVVHVNDDGTTDVLWERSVALRIDPAVLYVAPRDVTVGHGQALPELSGSADAVTVEGWKNDDGNLVNALFARYNFHVEYQLAGADAANLPANTTYPITMYETENPDVEPVAALNNYTISCGQGTLIVVPDGISYIGGWDAPAFAAGTRYYDGTTSTVQAVPAIEGSTVYYSVNGGEWTQEAPQMTDAGSYVVQARAVHPDYSEVAISSATYNVLAAPVSINIEDAIKNVFEDEPTYVGTITGLVGDDTLNVEYYRANTSNAPGTYRIFARYDSNPNYAVTVNPGMLTIRPLPTQAVPPTEDPVRPAPTTPTTPTTPTAPSAPTAPTTPTTPSNTTPSTISGIGVEGTGGNNTTNNVSNQGTANQGTANQGTANQGTANQGNTGIQNVVTPTPGSNDNNAQNVITPAPADNADATTPEAGSNTAEAEAPADAAAAATEGIVVIDDASTPMASSGAPVYSPSTTIDTGLGTPEVIQDDNNPLGAFDEPICWVHWALLLGVMITAGFGIIVVRRRMASVDAVTSLEAQMLGATTGDRPVYAPIPEYRVR